ncbi:monosaccharide ABC transporter ATP-binding protein (CUT2 family) [Silicimonas algicola]|uniref:Monosaccharide ABC transporter ATP-binding protein (CUT2 family) n=2 Tax=Silicimonas algicola TaxID=1826607 RepID=A0A316G4C6_9RHOB|nr:monosaccharide ABC transporter ATP-binding protein (CUT2 family) [Silicimonas algicola]
MQDAAALQGAPPTPYHEAGMDSTTPHVALEGVSRYFGGITALKDVDFQCRRGTIHAILGENGAGKSTLIKIMAGVLPPSEGRMLLDGRPVAFRSPAEARDAGIVCIFQELSLIPDLSVADNIFIDRPPRSLGLIDRRAQRRRSEELLARIDCEDVNPDTNVRDLSLSRRQMVEIAKAISKNPSVLILDEATSALTSRDVQTVYDLLGKLREDNVASLFISHRMHEVDALCDTLSVFRNGHHIETFGKGERTSGEIVRLMIGRDIEAQFPPKPAPVAGKSPALKVEALKWEDRLKGIDIEVAPGEILGLGGLDGQGHKELLLALFGVLKGVTGRIELGGRPYRPASPARAKRQPTSLALVPEDRKTEGLMLQLSIADNLLTPNYARVSTGPLIDRSRADTAIADAVTQLQIKVGDVTDKVETLSGGNQQKVVIAKWLIDDPDVILLNDPTRGIDVGTKQEIYRLMRQLADAGKAIVLYSTDYDELIGCCDRVSILYDGRVVAELDGERLTEENIVSASLNIPGGEAA